MTRSFKGKVALVTGASSGIGRETALTFAAHGAKVALASRRREETLETVHAIERNGGEALFVQTDVSQSGQVSAMVDQVIERFGALDVAFNNAGIEGDPFVPVERYSEEVWDAVVSVNLKGMFLCMKYQLPHLVKSKGVIVNMASVAGLTGGRLGVAYYATKHGVVGMTKAAAIEYADKGVRINAVAPGVIVTDMAQRAFFQDAATAARVTSLHPMGRLGQAQEVANAVFWLSSSASSFTTGHVLTVDGGFTVP